MSISQKQPLLILLEKKDKDRRFIKNWHPISLINVDVRILSKALAKGWFPYDRKRSQTIADDRGSQIVDRRRSQRDLFPYNEGPLYQFGKCIHVY